MPTGVEQAWETLSQLNPQDVCRRTGATFDRLSGTYSLKSFLQDIFICPQDRKISGHSPLSNLILNQLGRYSRLSILWYLISARDVPPSGKLIRPADVAGGEIYLKGTHALPLSRIAEKFNHNIPDFLNKGRELGGKELEYGDACIELFPFPRIPVLIELWESDDEFSSRCSLLFDSTCELHLPTDVIWSTAMMSILIML